MISNIHKKENTLYKKYENILNWVKDGVVNEENYKKANVKVLYILKEANGGKNKTWQDKGSKNGDLRNYLNKHANRWQTWNNVVRWQYGIENLNNDDSWKQVFRVKPNFRKEYLRHTAVINLKKLAGNQDSNMNEILKHANVNKELLKQQIALYQPNIVICGGTGNIVKEIGLFEGLDKWEKSERGVFYYTAKNKTIIVSYKHPGAREAKNKMFFDIIKTIKEAKSTE